MSLELSASYCCYRTNSSLKRNQVTEINSGYGSKYGINAPKNVSHATRVTDRFHVRRP
jgi:hypothetical protein